MKHVSFRSHSCYCSCAWTMAQYRRNLTRNDVLQQIFEDNDSADEDLDDGGEVGAPEFDDDDEFILTNIAHI